MAGRSHVQGRHRVGAITPWLIAIFAAALLTSIVFADQILVSKSQFELQKPAPLSVRVSPLQPSPFGAHGGAIAIERGEILGAEQVAYVQATPSSHAGNWLALYFAIGIMLLTWSSYLRSRHWGALLRRQLATLSALVLLALGLRLLFLLTSLSILAAPVGVMGLLVGKRASRGSAVASGALLALIVAAMVPLELGIAAALLLQAILPALLLPRNPSPARVGSALAIAGLASACAYAIAYVAAWQTLPSLEDPLHSTWLAALFGAAISGGLVWILRPAFEWLCGEVSRRTLSRLEKLSQPLLKQIATQAPGTWQHSLAMANLAQTAGAPIGADLQLLRVGAYYHDIGKTLAPKYFIENLGGGETSVHENLKASASRDAIFAHVNEGIRVAREFGLPERVIDFIRSHHGGGSLEYFWTLEQSSPGGGSAQAQDFCYPGTRPQCRETGILCICDAVEGACRNLKNASRFSIERLVHHIIYGKLRAGQLDECGLSLADAQRIDYALSESLVQAHTPNLPRARGADGISTSPDAPRARSGEASSALGQLSEVRLDSLDLPKLGWQQEALAQLESTQRDASMAFNETEAVPALRSANGSDATDDDSTITGGTQDALETRTTKEHGVDRVTTRRRAEDQDDSEVEDRVTAKRNAEDPDDSEVEDRVTAKRKAEDPDDSEVEDRLTAKRKAEDPDVEETALHSTGSRRSVQPVQGSRDEADDEVVLLKSPKKPSGSQKAESKPEGLGEWQEALGATQITEDDIQTPGPPPPPPPPPSGARETIPLGKDGLLLQPGPAQTSRPGKRADSSDGMRPGEMVVGAPPATHPERTLPGMIHREDITAEHFIALPDEARRPEDRITEESPAVFPIDAYPETSTSEGPGPEKKSKI